jgi:integrase
MITDTKARRLQPGEKPVGDGTVAGLRLEPAKLKGHGKWILRFVSPVSGKRRDMGLGVYPDVSIAEARKRGTAAREKIALGLDPIDQRHGEQVAPEPNEAMMTFETAARQVHAEKAPGWKNGKHVDQWLNTLSEYVFPRIGNHKVADLTPRDFAEVLRPIWITKPETASRIRQRCDVVMKWCWAHGTIPGNPVDVVDHLLPRQPGKRERVQHQPAMPWRDIPDFVGTVLRPDNRDLSRTLLEFVILTAARSGEARAMTWDEVNLEEMVWTVPAERMKSKAVHRVPLSDRAIEILKAQQGRVGQQALVFPSPRGKVPTDMILTSFLRRHGAASGDAGRTATAHGFRSSFRDWASENGYSRDLAERALAHTIKNAAEAAYHRTDLLEARRTMMNEWSRHVCGATS